MGYSFYYSNLSFEALLTLIIAGLIGIAVAVLFLLNLQQTLQEVSDHNRQIAPGRVWLMLIPLFNVGYAFYLFPKMSESLRLEFHERGIPQGGDYALGLGRAYAILGVLGLLNRYLMYLAGLVSIGSLVVLILLWVKMAQFKNLLRNSKRNGAGLSNHPDLLD